jgi:hypothetical protein
MQELINEIAAKAGITVEQATTAFQVMQEKTAGQGEGIMDQLKEKAGGLLHNLEGNETVQKAEEMLGGVKDKIAGFFK